MKTILKLTPIFILLVLFSTNTNAQDEKKCPLHKHGWHMADSAAMADFSSSMENFNMQDFPFCKHKNKFNGHWAGFELAFSGYVNPDFNMTFNPAYPYMNMNTARSITVNFNPFELNLNLYKNKIGLTTGLGFQTSNYYFTDDYVMIQDSASLVAFQVQDAQGNPVSMHVNKMVVSYLNLPLFFEYQTNPLRRINSFHVTVGVIAGVRIGSYTKQQYNDKGESYVLVDAHGNQVATFDVDKYSVQNRGSYHLSPFKVDAAFRIGWSRLNLFGTYSLTQMFQKNQGPELYPFTVGITLLGW
ncbi:MAG: outer membrane beta-barrel protein [Bacteroidetes bacterium]|nr:outer membrane beta-barrel protein [Bacteroidota bacterium]